MTMCLAPTKTNKRIEKKRTSLLDMDIKIGTYFFEFDF